MAQTELFLFFPEYSDESMPSTHSFYIKTISIQSEEEVDSYIGKIQQLVNNTRHEDYEGYYDINNLKRFIYPLEQLPEYYPNRLTGLRRSLQNWENWSDSKQQNTEWFVTLWGSSIADDLLSEISWRKNHNPGNSFLIIDHEALYRDNPILVKHNQESITIDVRPCTAENILEWLSTNRKPQRNFHISKKHGKNGVGAQREHAGQSISVLLCSKEEASEMLHKAIGSNHDTLWFYDSTHKKVIEFRFENDSPLNQYHGFHLDNNVVKNRIPKEILNRLNISL